MSLSLFLDVVYDPEGESAMATSQDQREGELQVSLLCRNIEWLLLSMLLLTMTSKLWPVQIATLLPPDN